MATARSNITSRHLLRLVHSPPTTMMRCTRTWPRAALSSEALRAMKTTTTISSCDISPRSFSTTQRPRDSPNGHLRPTSCRRSSTRSYATVKKSNGQKASREIAVLGGGLTGLTAAHYLARHARDAHITLFEAGKEMGGWVNGSGEDTPEGKVVMHKGPRMIRSGRTAARYDDLVFYDVLVNLKIQDQLKEVGQAAGTRYLYYPDHLVRLPGPPMTASNIISAIQSLMTEPLWDGLLPAARSYLGERLKLGHGLENSREHPISDESVGDFLERILGDDRPVKNIVSGMMHGIYGGDVYKLSAKHTIFQQLWYKFANGDTGTWVAHKDWSLIADIMDGPNRLEVQRLANDALDQNMLAFDDGMLTLVRHLERDLERQPNVTIARETVKSLTPRNGKVQLMAKSDVGATNKTFDKVISTIVASQLSELANPAGSLSVLDETHAVTILVVNIWYPERDLLKDNPGFGYLIPVSTPDNDANILGVIFDSEAQGNVSEPGTKLTVMMGGHYWDGNLFLPTEEQGTEMAVETVKEHLGIPRMPGMRTSARMCYNCLPQHFVGHRELMARAHAQLLETFEGSLMVAGPSYTPAGVMPAMRAGFEAAMRVARGTAQPWMGQERSEDDRWWRTLPSSPGETVPDLFRQDHIGETGLEGFTHDEVEAISPADPKNMWFRKAMQIPVTLNEKGFPCPRE